MRILLAKRRALGDTVLLTSTIANLARSLPGAEIYALVPGASAPLLEGHPDLRGVFHYDEGFLSLVARIRALQLDEFIQLHSSPSQRWLVRFAGAKRVSHAVQNGDTEKAYGKHPNALEWDGFFLRTLLGGAVGVPAPLPRIYLSESERSEGARYWQAQGADPSRLVFFGLGAGRPTKRWPASHFGRLAELFRDRLELRVGIVPGPGEEEARFAGLVLDEMRARGLRTMGAGGKGDFLLGPALPVRRLAAAIGATRLYVGNDSGPKHIAVAVGLPTLTFFGPEDPGEWHPYDRARHPLLFREGLACRREDGGRWCGLEACDQPALLFHRCMGELDPLDAFEECRRLLS